MPLENFISLSPGIPESMIFDDHRWVAKTIRDPILGWDKTVQQLVFHVKEYNLSPVQSQFSLISQKAQNEMKPYLEGSRYKNYRFTWIKDGPGEIPPRIVSADPI